MSSAQRQREKRLRKRLVIEFGEAYPLVRSGFTTNVSPRGLCITSKFLHAVGSSLIMEVRLKDGRIAVLRGRVSWAATGTPTLGIPSMMGVQLLVTGEEWFQLVADAAHVGSDGGEQKKVSIRPVAPIRPIRPHAAPAPLVPDSPTTIVPPTRQKADTTSADGPPTPRSVSIPPPSRTIPPPAPPTPAPGMSEGPPTPRSVSIPPPSRTAPPPSRTAPPPSRTVPPPAPTKPAPAAVESQAKRATPASFVPGPSGPSTTPLQPTPSKAPPTMNELRAQLHVKRDQRFQKKVPVTFGTLDAHEFSGLTFDVGLGGVSIETLSLRPVGTELELEFELPNGSWARCRGKVVRTRRFHLLQEEPNSMAVRFEDVDGDWHAYIAVLMVEG